MEVRSLALFLFCIIIIASCVIATPDEVLSLPDLPPLTFKIYSSEVVVNPDFNSTLYYLFMGSKSSTPLSDPVVIWLSGGPGCSSLFGTFVENGPFIMTDNGTWISNNPWAWNTNANVLYIDNPSGTGFARAPSYASLVTNETDLVDSLYIALNYFYGLHPEYADNDLYIFGESYAGKYMPPLALRLMKDPAPPARIKGIGFGNAAIDPHTQARAYAPFLLQHGLIPENIMPRVDRLYDYYSWLIATKSWDLAFTLEMRLLNHLIFDAGGISFYDIRYTYDPSEAPCIPLRKYLNREDVLEALHVPGNKWAPCSNLPYWQLNADEERSVLGQISEILSNGSVRILLYNGEYDLICCDMGTLWCANMFQWDGQQGFLNAANVTWTVAGSEAGYSQSYAQLSRVVIYNAGHMSPYNQPQNTHSMLYSWLAGDL